MTDFILTPNMGLPEPIVGVTSGPNYATYLDSCLTIIDGHTHLTGSGVPITPAALNINANINMSDWSLSSTASIDFTLQTTSPSNSSIYSKTDGNLYFTNATGGVVQITNGLTVNASSSGIVSGTATASFSAGVLVVNQASSTPANIQAGSILIGNNLINSKFITLSAPSSLGSSYTLVLPSIPAQTNVMTIDSSGNMGSVTYDTVGQDMTSVGTNAIGASMTSIGANAVAASMTRPINTAAIGSVCVSSSSGVVSAGQSFSSIANVTITTNGRPVMVMLQPDASSNAANIQPIALNNNTTFAGQVLITRDGGTYVGLTTISCVIDQYYNITSWPAASFSAIDLHAGAGAHTYNISFRSTNSFANIEANYVVLVAYEL